MPPDGLSTDIDYKKLIDDLLADDKFTTMLPGGYGDVLKKFLNMPGMADILQSSIKMASKIKDDKMDLKKFYMKIRKLFIEMSKFYGWPKGTHYFNMPNENIWNENDPKACLPSANVRNFMPSANFNGTKYYELSEDATEEWFQIYAITNRVDTNLKNLTKEDFEFLNKLHKKFTNKEIK